MNKLLKKLTGKAKAASCDDCKCEEPCTPCRDTKFFVVTAILDESRYNKELGKWLFIDPFDGDIKVVDHRIVEWTRLDSMYRITDAIYSGPFCEVNIKRQTIVNQE